MGVKRWLFGPGTVGVLGTMMLLGIALQLLDWCGAVPGVGRIGLWLELPFLVVFAILVLVVVPWTWWTTRRQ